MKKISIILLCSIFSIPLFAYSGMGDSMMDRMLNTSAICAIVFLTQLILMLVLRQWLKSSRYFQKLYDSGGRVCTRKYLSVLVFWLLFSFVAAPYLGVISSITLDLIWFLFLPISFLLLFIRRWRVKWMTGKDYAVLLNLSLLQVVGLIVYGLVYRLPIFQKIFFYDWGEVPELGFYSYADESAYGYLLLSFIESLAVLFIPIIVYMCFGLIKSLWNRWIKNQK